MFLTSCGPSVLDRCMEENEKNYSESFENMNIELSADDMKVFVQDMVEFKENLLRDGIEDYEYRHLRFVEKETNTPPRELKNLVSQSGKWDENEVEKWNLSLYINRMLEGGVTGKKQEPFLEYPAGLPKKNRYVILTDAGRNYLESLTRV